VAWRAQKRTNGARAGDGPSSSVGGDASVAAGKQKARCRRGCSACSALVLQGCLCLC